MLSLEYDKIDQSSPVSITDMLIIPEIQIQNGALVTRSTASGEGIVHDKSVIDQALELQSDGARMLQIVDVDAARKLPENNEDLIKEIISAVDIPVQISGGIRTLNQINDWFDCGAARVVLGTIAITDSSLVLEAANRYPGGIIVHLTTQSGYVVIDGWKVQTAFRPQDLILDLQATGIAGIIHRANELENEDPTAALALTEQLSHEVSIPVYSNSRVESLDDIARLRYLPNINGAVISHSLVSGEIKLSDVLAIAAEKETPLEPESITQNVKMGVHRGVRAYLAAYNHSQAARMWNSALRETITSNNPFLEIVIPQIDLETEQGELTPREIQSLYEQELDKVDIVIVILEGVENKAWTGFECGYARAKGKYIYGIAGENDLQSSSVQRFVGMCDEVVVYHSEDDMTKALTEVAQGISARVMVQNQQ